MKICPQCRAHYPTHFYVCPQDGKALNSVSDFPTGTLIRKKYEILKKLGQGGMGTVYKAKHVAFNEICALKIVSEQLAQDEQFRERFLSEAVIMRRLNHPNAVHVIDIDKTEDDRPFIVMEYVEGENLRELLARRGALPVPEALEIARQVCSALTAAHGLNVLHRDIKPDNLLIVSLSEGNPLIKVADFGVAKIKESTAQYGLQEGVATRAGVVLGTPAYMSPEQALGKPGSQLDARSDIYSLGVVLYEILTGAQPFTAETPMGIMLQHMQTVPKPPHELTPGHNIPRPVSAVVMKALEKDPADRFPSAAEMQTALTAAAGEVSTAAPTVPYDPGAPAPVVTPTPTPTPPASSLTPPPEIPKSVSTATSPEMTLPTAPQEPRRVRWPFAGSTGTALAVLALVAVGGWNFFPQRPTQPVQPSQPESATPEPADKTTGGQTKPAKDEQNAQQRRAAISRHLTAAQQAFERGDYDAAIRSCEAALVLDPSNQMAKNALERARRAKAAEETVLRRLKPPK